MRTAIIIPCYNESKRLKFDSYRSFLNQSDDYVLCFVNDGSSDNTLEVLKEFAAEYSDLIVILDLERNVGKAEAVRRGMEFMLAETEVQYLGYLDADLATGFEDFLRLENVLIEEGRMMAFGSRKLDAEKMDRSLFRQLASAIIGMITRIILDLPVMDTQCGAKIFSKDLAYQVFSKPFLSRWLFDIEIFLRIKQLFGAETMSIISEVALRKWEDVDGSKITLKDSVRFPLHLIEIGYFYKFNNVKKMSPAVARLKQAA